MKIFPLETTVVSNARAGLSENLEKVEIDFDGDVNILRDEIRKLEKLKKIVKR